MSIINSMPDNISLMNGWLPDTMVWELFAGADMTIVPYIDASQSGVVYIVQFGAYGSGDRCGRAKRQVGREAA